MAAGLGFKTFTTGEVLTAADTNGYLMQGVLVFATAAARDAAITSPQEGQFAFTKDTNGLWYYDGAAWVASGATGDIEGVTAGTGISGGGTSGTVTVTNSMATAIDAKGDLVVGTGADAFSRLAVGTNTYLLTADSAEATGLKWAAPAGGGKVLQVVSTTYETSTSTTGTTFVDSGLTLSITPTLNTSKILVMVTQHVLMTITSSNGAACQWKLLRGSTDLSGGTTGTDGTFYTQLGTTNAFAQLNTLVSYTYLDAPATTSSTTYKTQIALYTSGGGAICYAQQGTRQSTLTLLEIGA